MTARTANSVTFLLLMFTAGTGGFAQPNEASGITPTSTHVSLHPLQATELRGTGRKTRVVPVPERIAEIRQHLSLNVSQIAEVMQVGRPAVYSWLNDQRTPRSTQQDRLSRLYTLATQWRRRSSEPVGKYLILPLDRGESLLGLLRKRDQDAGQIDRLLDAICAAIASRETRRQRGGYRSAASIIKKQGYKQDSPEVQQQRIEDAAD